MGLRAPTCLMRAFIVSILVVISSIDLEGSNVPATTKVYVPGAAHTLDESW